MSKIKGENMKKIELMLGGIMLMLIGIALSPSEYMLITAKIFELFGSIIFFIGFTLKHKTYIMGENKKSIDNEWPNCSVPGCPFKSCLALGSDKCYPHTIEERRKDEKN